jgi:ankyrin repeat protein
MDKSEQQRFNSKQVFNSEALFNAAKKGLLNRVHQIIANGPVDIEWGSPEAKYYGQTAIIVAIRKGHQDIAEFLIENGANVNKGCRYNFTPLMYAVIEKSVPMVEMLLSHGANPNIRNSNNDPPLNLAAWQGNQQMVDALRIGGAIPNHSAMETLRIYHPKIVRDNKKVNTLNTMYVMQDGLNSDANVFNQVDPQTWTDLNEYYGGKRRTNRKRTNKKRTNKRRTNRTQ